jgi:hypothetical protein
MVSYTLFGAMWLGFLVATVMQVAINDGNYYQMINGGQNALGQVPGWRRWHTCLLVTVIAAGLTWWFPRVENGFFTVAGWSSIALPSATVVMAVDVFVLPRFVGRSRSMGVVPSWRAAGAVNVPGVVSVVAAVLFGAWGLGLLPGVEVPTHAGLVPVEAWVLAAVLYLLLAVPVGRSRRAAPLLGFPAAPSAADAGGVAVAGPGVTEAAAGGRG